MRIPVAFRSVLASLRRGKESRPRFRPLSTGSPGLAEKGIPTPFSLRLAEQPDDLRRALPVQLHDVAGPHALEQPLDVLVAQADAPVRFREADRARVVRAMDAESPEAQSNPPRPDGIGCPRSNDL